MVRLLPIASGKGGVGKSVISANLGLALSRADRSGHPGRTVVLVDLDLGASNLHTFLGMKNKHAGIGALVWKKEDEGQWVALIRFNRQFEAALQMPPALP